MTIYEHINKIVAEQITLFHPSKNSNKITAEEAIRAILGVKSKNLAKIYQVDKAEVDTLINRELQKYLPYRSCRTT
ncbi:hypothetical protein [Risungbinella massiliensis]|uniref:hypothetical protein n=1 Tax=Risungbinella massiliensis TaxID=1329796 RepID=UPI0005CC7826|nr:hypothetical protein [Risungbinella massiliensis]